jgi:Protein kinase domain
VTALREIVLLRQLEHPNVVKLENVVMDPARLYLVFELVDTGERAKEKEIEK